MIEARDLSFGYRRPDELFAGFDWSAGRGEVWSILGPSGCGKTTLLYLLAGLRRPTGGTVLVDGTPVEGVRRTTGLILQDHGLLPWATVEGNAGLGLQIRGVPSRQASALVGHWLEVLGIADLRRRYPSQISGGQRQRVAIARALVLDPDLLLMDEPFASLDALTREELQEALLGLRLAAERTLTIVLVTHDVAEAVLLGHRVMVLTRPPIREPLVFENPLAGSQEYRLRPEYHAKCLEVRAAVLTARRGPTSNGRSADPPSSSRTFASPSAPALGIGERGDSAGLAIPNDATPNDSEGFASGAAERGFLGAAAPRNDDEASRSERADVVIPSASEESVAPSVPPVGSQPGHPLGGDRR